MAGDVRSIDVTLYVTEGQGQGASDDGRTPTLPKPKSTEKSKGNDNSNLSNVTAMLLHEAWNYAKNETLQIANYEINKYFSLKDDYIGQRNMTVAKNIISKGVSMGTAIASGFAVGGVVGGALAIVGSSVSLGVEIAQNYDQENVRLRQMNAQLEFSRQRAGYSLISESVGENL